MKAIKSNYIYIKQSILAILFLLLSTSTLYAATGKIGTELEYIRTYNSNSYRLLSNSINVKIVGENHFGKSNIVGFEYGIGYIPFQSDAKTDVVGISSNLGFSLNFDTNKIVSIFIAFGSEYNWQNFNGFSSHTIGLYTSSGIDFNITRHFSMGLRGYYHLPMLMLYENTAKDIIWDNQLAGLSLHIAFCY